MSTSKKIVIVIIVIILLIMIAMIIKNLRGPSAEEQVAMPTNAKVTISTDNNNNASTISERSNAIRERDRAALEERTALQGSGATNTAANASLSGNQTADSTRVNATAAANQTIAADNKTTQHISANATNINETRAPATTNDSKNASNVAPNQNATNVTAKQEQTVNRTPSAPLGKVNVTVEAKGQAVVLRINASNAIPSYKYSTLSSPTRVMVDLSGQWNQGNTPSVGGQRMVSKVRFGKHRDAFRIVADLNTQGQVSVDVQKISTSQLIITITPR